MEGYVKLHRQLLDSTQFADPIRLKIWIWCLCKANYKSRAVPLKTGKGYTTVMVNRGQFIFGRNKASDELNIAGSTIYRHLEKLEEEKAILIRSDNQYSIITICKYEDYQSIEEESEQPTDNQRTTNGQASDTNNKDNKEKKVKKEKKVFCVAPLNASQTLEVFNYTKTSFLELYADQYETEYYFLAVDGTKIQSLITKVVFKMKEKNKDAVFSVDDISLACKTFIDATYLCADDWLKGNFSLKNIDSKFNDIYSQIKLSYKNGQITNHKTKPISKYAPQR